MLCSSSLKAIRSGESAVEIKLSLWAQQRFSGPCWLAIEPSSPPLFSFRNIWVGSNCNKIQARRDTHTLEHTKSRYTLYTQWRITEHAHTNAHISLYGSILTRVCFFSLLWKGHTERKDEKHSCVMVWDETLPSYGIKSTCFSHKPGTAPCIRKIMAAETERLRPCFAVLEIAFKESGSIHPLSQKELPELAASCTLSPPLHRLATLLAQTNDVSNACWDFFLWIGFVWAMTCL